MGSVALFAGTARTEVGILLLLAGISKFLRSASFVEIVRAYRLVTGRLVLAVARVLPCLEIFVGLALIADLHSELFLPASSTLLGVFALAMSIKLLQGDASIACGCFGDAHDRISWTIVGRNTGLALLCVSLLAIPQPQGLSDPLVGSPSALEAIGAIFCALGVLAALLFIPTVINLWDVQGSIAGLWPSDGHELPGQSGETME